MRAVLLAVLLLVSLPVAAEIPSVPVLAYHDVRDSVAGDYDSDQFAVSTRHLIEHFSWLRQAGFQPISLAQLRAAMEGRATLPEKPVILTFDDGLASVYDRVFPLLRLFEYPAVVSIVTSWIDHSSEGELPPGKKVMTWDQIRELKASGLVEIASHSHDMHRGIRGNPQGNEQPATVTRHFDGTVYEDGPAYTARVRADLETSARRIAEETGDAPVTMTWPFGAFNYVAAREARASGMSVSLTLEPTSFRHEGVLHLGRKLITANPNLTDFSAELTLEERPPVVRVAQVDLDYVHDVDPAQQERNLGRLLDRIKSLKISHVYLQAFSDVDADGGASQTYFPNRHLPMKADLFNRVAWQLKTRADVRVYAWMPMLSFVGEAFDEDWRVQEHRDGRTAPDPDAEPRLSPFSEDARRLIGEIYEDLAVHARFDGLLFHDDGRLSDIEDFSSPALEAYAAELGSPLTPAEILGDPAVQTRIQALKTRTLISLSRELTAVVRQHIPAVRTARNLFASALLDDRAPGYLAQDYDLFLQTYDYVALMAMPHLEKASDEKAFYNRLIKSVARRPDAFDRTIFELQTVDWAAQERIDSRQLMRTMRWLQSRGVRNIGYYPDDFVTGHPRLPELRQGLSLSDDMPGAAL